MAPVTSRLLTTLSIAAVLLCGCYYPYYPPPGGEIRWVDTPVGKAAAVGGPIRAPKIINQVTPAATNSAGFAQVRVVISPQGTVSNVEILAASDDAAAKSAKEALAKWKFTPTFLEGSAIPVVHEFKITFKKPS